MLLLAIIQVLVGERESNVISFDYAALIGECNVTFLIA